MVEEVSVEQFYSYLREFSGYMIDQKTNSIPEEYLRFIKNMANVSEKDDVSIFDALKIDITDETNNEQKSKMIFEALSKICSYEQRKNTIFSFSDTKNDFSTWCKETFYAINDGKMPNVPMPKKIILELSDNELNCEIPHYIRSIIDTRGLDTGERPDIQNYISSQNSIT